MKIFLYGHGGSGNHGCEAIVRSTQKILQLSKEKIILLSENKEEDIKYGLEDICIIRDAKQSYSKKTKDFVKAYFNLKVRKNYREMDKMPYRTAMKEIRKGDIVLSIGGDNYCYADVDKYIMLHELAKERGAKTVLWGCSIEPELVEIPQIASDLRKYDLITARESISYDAIKKVNSNTKMVADPAFVLDICEDDNTVAFFDNSIVGINISPMIVNNEFTEGITKKNYIKLMDYILAETDMKIALIPHVIWHDGDDRKILEEFYEKYCDTGKVILVEDNSCEILKNYISQCRFFIGARTHSTIAAYSSNVPTLVVGYSVKARGIAKDLFGTMEGYVLPVQMLKTEGELLDAFFNLMSHEEEIKHQLEMQNALFKERAYKGLNEIKKI